MDGFEVEYKRYYNAVRDVVVDLMFKEPGLSSFADVRACAECEAVGKRSCEDKTVLRINSKYKLVVVELEKFFIQFDGTSLASVRDKCDLMLYDDMSKRLAFCEMTCSQERYVWPYENSRGQNVGKRAKAYKQLKSSICKLASVPGIAAKMDSYKIRSALFAVRFKDMVGHENTSVQSMVHSFSGLARSIQDGSTQDMGNGFAFEVVQYPTVFQW